MAANPGNTTVRSPLLHAWHDPLAGLNAYSSCVKLADLNCDGDNKLIVCDIDKKLKIYKGTSVIMETGVPDRPVAIAVMYTDTAMPRIPSIAVAAGSHVFIYRQVKAFRKWMCPPLDISAVETDVWNDLRSDAITAETAAKFLSDARDSGVFLSARSVDLLSMENENDRNMYISAMKEIQYVQTTLITCMDILKKDTEDFDGVGLPVIGTEAGQILILPSDPQGSNFLCKVQLPSPPAILSVSGIFDVDWRINVICRDGKMYSVKNGDSRGTAVVSGSVVELGAQGVAVARQEKNLWVATMDRAVSCYSNRGKRLKGIMVNEDVADLCMLTLKRAKANHLLLVALASGKINMYRDLTNIYSFEVDKPIMSMCYGLYGREENSLIIIHGAQGALTIKIWRRAADTDSIHGSIGPPPEQDIPLQVPKKTKLYVEQTQREREKAPEIHKGFQRDLCKLRLTTARAYVKTLTDGSMGGGTSSIGSQDVRVQVAVSGLGPKFLLKITLQNSSPQPILNSRLVLTFDQNLYTMGHTNNSEQSFIIPVLLPGPKHVFESQVLSTDPQGRAGQILILLCPNGALASEITSGSAIPILSASVRMPVSEPAV